MTNYKIVMDVAVVGDLEEKDKGYIKHSFTKWSGFRVDKVSWRKVKRVL